MDNVYNKYLNLKNSKIPFIINETNFCYSRSFENNYQVTDVEKLNEFTVVTCHCLDENLEKILILNNNDKVVSYAEFIYKEDSTFIAKVFTEDEYRRKGLCRKTISIIEKLSMQCNGNKPIRLNCEKRIEDDKTRNRNYDFYKKIGFVDYHEDGIIKSSRFIPMIKILDKTKVNYVK